MVSDSSDEGVAAADGTSRRDPPTIDLDPSEVSGDTVSGAKAPRHSVGDRWRRLRARIRPSLVQQRGIIIGTICVAILILVAAWGSDWMNTVGRQTDSFSNPNAALNEMTARLDRLEAQVKNAPATDSSSRLSAIESAIKNLGDNVGGLQRKIDATASALDQLKNQPRGGAVDLGPLISRVTRLEQAASAASGEAPQSNLPLRRAIAAQALDAAVRSGQPFVDVLASAKRLSNDAAGLAPLDSFATSGVPNDATLGSALLALLPKPGPRPTQQPIQSASGSLLDRLMASASRLVQVQRVDTPSEDAATNSAPAYNRVEAAVRSGNLAQARREIEGLPESGRAAVKPWLDSVARRDAALEAAHGFALSSMSALTNDSSPASSPRTPAQ